MILTTLSEMIYFVTCVGPVNRLTDPLEPFPHNMDPQLRTLGLQTTLVKGVPTLTSEHIVCRKGDTLTAEQV